jgi:hypothetical protein
MRRAIDETRNAQLAENLLNARDRARPKLPLHLL